MTEGQEYEDVYADEAASYLGQGMEVLNPVAIETRIRQVSDDIAAGVKVVTARYDAYLRADHAYDLAVAAIQDGWEGAAWKCEAAVTLGTVAERKARDRAEVVYKYADRRAKALESELRAYQSVGASVREMYRTAGRS